MKHTKLASLLLFTILFSAGCRQDSPGVPGDKSSSPDRTGPALEGGSIGNGLKRNFSSTAMQVAFTIPDGWNVEGNETKFSLSNEKSVNGPLVSKIEFSLVNEIDGIRFTSADDLKQYITKQKPGARFFTADFGSRRKGFWTETIKDGRRTADYFILDENKNIMRIHIEAVKAFRGEQTVLEIINALTIDGEGPVVKKVYFSPATAKAGDKVLLVVEAEDEISGLDPARSASENTYGDGSWNVGRFGYRIQGGGGSGDVGGHRFHPEKFTLVSATKFVYEWTVPKNSPVGDVKLSYLKLFDRKGNHTEIQCTDIREGCQMGTMPIPKVTIVKGDAADYFEDKNGPQLKDVYFDRSFVSHGDKKIQRLFVELTDETAVAPYYSIYSHYTKRGENGNYSTCVRFPSNRLAKVRDNLWAIDMDVSGCNSDQALVYVTDLRFYDEIGNVSAYSSYDKVNHLPQTRFEFVDK